LLTRQQTSHSGSAGWYFWYQSIHIQITYTSVRFVPILSNVKKISATVPKCLRETCILTMLF
jgi:hypothetical protein